MSDSRSRTVLLCGATGLVGGECLRLLSADSRVERVIVLTRRALPSELNGELNAGKIDERIVDFDRLEATAGSFRADQIICALGTTIRKAGSRERFRRVDRDYVLEIARLGLARGASHFLLVSATGANPRSRFFYNRVKGEVEAALTSLGYRSLSIVRPSLLLGERTEFRLGEEIGKRLGFLFPAGLRPVQAGLVAAALLQLAAEDARGRRVVESGEIPALGGRYAGGGGS